ncbi:MAG: hypothetical protein EU533_00990 [Promethearchaeota archaeon]|nr:MAG: hypothetical protein EU533_00990 [Candidatus Lokiarchaeota archaeon]
MYEKIKINKNKIKFLFALILLIGFNFISYPSFQVSKSSFDQDSNEIKSSGTCSPISIDDLPSSLNNWSWAETQTWFGGGSGTPSDPYILEDLIIDGGGTSNCILIQNSFKHFIIRNCTVFNSGTVLFASGILLFNVTNSQIIGNNASNNQFMGISVLASNYNVISGNIANNNTNYGITLGDSHNNSVSENIANENLDHGIYVGGSQDNTIFDNYAIKNGGYGIRLEQATFNFVSGNTASNNTNSGFYLLDSSNNNTLFENYAYYNGNNGIYCVDSVNNVIENTVAHYNKHNGIYLQNSNDTIIIDNELSDSIENGIKMEGSYENWIEGTTALDNGFNGIYSGWGNFNTFRDTIALRNGHNGIYLQYNDECSILENHLSNSTENGLKMDYCTDNWIEGTIANDNIYNGIYGFVIINTLIEDTSASNNGHNGIFLQWSEDNTIINNILYDNIENGLKFELLCPNNLVYGNILRINGFNGLLIEVDCDYNLIYDNLLDSNTDKGISIGSGCDDNLIYSNFFLENGIHALDHGSNNAWVGNYWDNWTTPDSDHNGIVDIPYSFIVGSAGSIDYVPIAEDGEPWILINYPNNHDVYGINPPYYSVTIIDDYLSEMWYTLDDGLNNFTFTEFSGNIDKSTWDLLPDGTYTLIFYASDKAGNVAFKEINIKKDTVAPTINIISPVSTDIFISVPSFIVKILDANLDAMWYSLDGGLTNYTFNSNGTINQAVWGALPEGQVTITFYAKDLVGHLSYANVSFSKTSGVDPIIMIIIIGSTIGGVVVIIGLLMYLRKRRKPGKE